MTVKKSLSMQCNNNYNSLLGEKFNKALLDSGCSKTVCGKAWLQVYRQTLSGDKLKSSHKVMKP